MSYADYEYAMSAALLVLAMYGMGVALTAREFLAVARTPGGVFLVLVLQAVVCPLVAIGLARLFSAPRGIAVGMVLVAALPGGSFSNLLAYAGRGNAALSISATAVSTVACLATTSLVLRVFGGAQLPADFAMPIGRIVIEIVCCLLAPLAAGMATRRLAPVRGKKLGDYCLRGSLVLLAVLVASALASGRLQLAAYGWREIAAVALFAVVSLWIGYGSGFLLRLPIADSFTIAIEVLLRNGGLGLLLAAALFPASGGTRDLADDVLFVVLLYGGLSLLIAGGETYVRRNGIGFLYGPRGLANRRQSVSLNDDGASPEDSDSF